MTLINNIRLDIDDSKDIAEASHDPTFELDPAMAYIVTMTSLKPSLEADPSDKGKIDEFRGKLEKHRTVREDIFKHLNSLDTEKAYMYLITTVLPFLQNQASERLDEQGKTMKKVSQLYDKWNEIHAEITKTAETLKKLREGKHVDDVNLDVTKIEFYPRSSDKTKWIVATIKDPNHILKIKINEKVAEFKKLLEQVKKKLPSSSKQLIDVLETSADKLILKDNYDKGWFNFNWNYQGEFKFEIETKNVPEFSHIDFNSMDKTQELKNIDPETMKKVIWDRLTGSSRFFIDSDQSKFKSYMDNIGQGITALTSISNMTQQQLQIDTQYYNSLLGFQKSAQDYLNKTIQTALNNMRS